MRRCPRCGSRRTGSAHACEGMREDEAVRTDGGQEPTEGRRDGPNDNPQQSGGHQPQQGGRRGQPSGQQRGHPPAGTGQGDGGVSRRQLLLGGGGALAVLGGGWFVFLRDDGDPTDSPDGVTKAFLEALIDGDRERANDLMHANSPMEGFTDTKLARDLEGQDVSIETAATDKESSYDPDTFDSVQEFAIVAVTFSADGEEEDLEVTVAQNTDGEWKMWLLAAF